MSRHLDPRPLFLGIDGGATHCRARLCDVGGQVLGEGVAGSANSSRGLERAFAEVMGATREALARAGLADENLGCIHAGLGLAGLSPTDQERLESGSMSHPFAAVTARMDAVAACLGAHQGQDGAILIIGTGTCGWLMRDGHSIRVGGWGFDLGDQGSAAHLGRAALRRALKEHDLILPPSALGADLLQHFQDNPENMLAWSLSAAPRDYGRFAPMVVTHAGNGDDAAVAIIEDAAKSLDDIIAALIARGAERIALVGGMAEHIAPWLLPDSKAALVPAQGDPLDGALMLARQTFAMETQHA